MDKNIFIPGKITTYSFCIILLLVLMYGMIVSPLKAMGSITSGEIKFGIGYPLTFFELDPNNTEINPINFKGLTIDLLIYIILAYILEVILKLILFLFIKKPIKQEREAISIEKIKQSKEAYAYYREQGMSEENILKLFQEKGWTEEQFVIYIKEVPENK